jgi:PTH1 family peptidyl-tRNA hydrolase
MIIFGLGNPGSRYRLTRHNAGRLFLDQLARYYKKRFVRKPGYTISAVRIKGNHVLLIKPVCWMNLCGASIEQIVRQRRGEFMIVMDDIDLPLGRMRLRSKGGDGGHRGLRSLIEALKTDEFPRLRIGIGQGQGAGTRIDAAEYVLQKFTREELIVLRRILREAIKGIQLMVTGGFHKAQNYINSANCTDVDQGINA